LFEGQAKGGEVVSVGINVVGKTLSLTNSLQYTLQRMKRPTNEASKDLLLFV